MARPRLNIDHEQIQQLKATGHSIREIASRTGVGVATIHRSIKGFGTPPARSKTAKQEDCSSTESRMSPAGISLSEIKLWRQTEHEAGRPSGLQDYFAAHGICFKCRRYNSACGCGGSKNTAAEDRGPNPRPDGSVTCFDAVSNHSSVVDCA